MRPTQALRGIGERASTTLALKCMRKLHKNSVRVSAGRNDSVQVRSGRPRDTGGGRLCFAGSVRVP